MGKIDFDHAKLEFEKYLRNFDLENSKIRLKQEHTFGVVKAADYICSREGMGEEDRELALLIALLHDIGRFEQLKVYNSYDDNRFDHAMLASGCFLKKERSVNLFYPEIMMISSDRPLLFTLCIVFQKFRTKDPSPL